MLSLLAWTTSVDFYCERTSPSFWSEPVNALTNLAFIAGAVWGVRTARQRGEDSAAVWVLIALAFAIGIGSFLFHTVAELWSSLADVIPIWTFVALASGICAVRLGGLRPRTVVIGALVLAVGVALLIATADGSAGPPRPARLNGSLRYAPAVAALAVFTVLGFARGHPLRWWVAAALGTFLVSLVARTFDLSVCPSFPLGLHWIWHVMNGLLIGLVLQIVLRAR